MRDTSRSVNGAIAIAKAFGWNMSENVRGSAGTLETK